MQHTHDQAFAFTPDGKPYSIRLAESWNTDPNRIDADADAEPTASRMNAVCWMLAALAVEFVGVVAAAAYYFVTRYGGRP